MPTKFNKYIDTIDECLTNGVKSGIFQVSLEDQSFNGRTVTIDGQDVVNFGSCSYLGLEVDDRLKQGAIDATLRYGTQYSSSRAYSSCGLYEEAESLFYTIFDNNPVILGGSTTLTHVAAIPILIQDDDLVILDHQVHGSVQMAVQLVKARGTKVEMIRHNRMDILEDLIKKNPNKYEKIWYMADGLYSMYGDFAPLDELIALMEKYGNFHVYIDDAHGMSWAGRNGNGYVLSKVPLHPKLILSTSLAKGFGAGGGLLVLSDEEMKRKILTCGSSYTTSGPVQPPMLGAIVASAKIHLTDEIYTLQSELTRRIAYTKQLIQEYDLPLVHPSDSPIFYIGLGMPRVGYNMVRRLLTEGFFTNIGIFPGVPVSCSGLRLAITNGVREEDIKSLLDAVQYHFPRVLEEEAVSVDKISTSFKMNFADTKARYTIAGKKPQTETLQVQYESTIHSIDKELWDNLLGDRGTFDWEGCRFIEETFQGNDDPENNWKLHYLIIKDNAGVPVLATYFTELLCKDDMVAPAPASMKIEEFRQNDKYYLTSKVVMMGSLSTVGDHLYIDRQHPEWRLAMRQMIKLMNDVKVAAGASMVQLRDLDTDDAEMRDFLIQEGFIKIDMPDTHIMTNIKWRTEEEYLSGFSTGSRWHFKKKILNKKENFNVCVVQDGANVTDEQINQWYQLYKNVKDRSFNINTYTLPISYFRNMIDHPNWEVIELRIKPELSRTGKEELVSTGFCYKTKNNYSIMAVGLDYDYVIEEGAYRVGLYESVVRANELKCDKLYLGMDAAVEKKRFGVEVIAKSVYIQADDNFNMELIGLMNNKN